MQQQKRKKNTQNIINNELKFFERFEHLTLTFAIYFSIVCFILLRLLAKASKQPNFYSSAHPKYGGDINKVNIRISGAIDL